VAPHPTSASSSGGGAAPPPAAAALLEGEPPVRASEKDVVDLVAGIVLRKTVDPLVK
jgi:hypothetical protein